MNLKHLVFVLMAVAVASSSVMAQQYLRIGTGGTAGTYYPVGVLVAKVVSQPGKIIATAQTSNGSLGNAIGVDSGSLETGFIQADVASWAHSGSGIFAGKPALSGLRLIANLYPESIHIVVRKASGIKSVLDLRGRRVALDEAGSGTLISARQVLGVYGLKESDIKPEYIKPNQAADRLRAGTIDAFFTMVGAPGKAISELAASGLGLELLALDGAAADQLIASNPFLFKETIAANTYPGIAAVATLAVGAQWVASDKLDAELVYQVTKALYSEAGQKALSSGHAKGRVMTLENAVRGAGIPWHPGAQRFFREVGVLK